MTIWGADLIERFPVGRDRPFLAYCATIGICILALGLRLLVGSAMPPGYPYVTFFPAVIISTFLFGFGPGVMAAFLCGFLAWYFFIPPFFEMEMSGSVAFALLFYALVVTIDILLIEWMQRANRRLAEERQRSRLLAERGELLFRELQHRVSNNLQVVSGLLTLQKRGITDDAACTALDEAARRLALIGRIHRQLYDPHGEQLQLGVFLDELGADLIDAAGRPGIACHVDTEADVHLPAESAIPVALIVAEAVTNAIEHGFAGRDTGEIHVTVARAADGMLELRVIDDGAGLPAGFDLSKTDSLGLKLAQMLARQLEGSFSLLGGEHTTALLRLP